MVRQVVEVPEAHALERAKRVPLLGEEDVVRLDPLERDHPERIVGEQVQEERARAGLDAPDELGGDRPALEDEHQARPPLAAQRLELPEDPDLVARLGAAVLVQDIVAAVGEGAHLVAHRHELVAEVHPHELGPDEGHHDQPAHAAEPSTAPGAPNAGACGPEVH